MNYYISDLHIGHNNVLQFDNRPFKDMDDMFNSLVTNWNNVVKDDDTVYILGDFIWYKESLWYDVVKHFNGKKVLVKGNHDPKDYSYRTKTLFTKIVDYLEIKDGGKSLILSHYPILFFKGDYKKDSYMLYGHVHNTKEAEYVREFRDVIRAEDKGVSGLPLGNLLHVGCMEPYMNYTPRTLEEIIEGDKITYPHPLKDKIK